MESKDKIKEANAEALEKALATKPTYHISNAMVSSGRLLGNIINHPRCCKMGPHLTSVIVKRHSDNLIETNNSMYIVDSWNKDRMVKAE